MFSLMTAGTMGSDRRASYFVEVSFADQLALILPFLAREKIPYLILGKGSNVLFDDRGYNGVRSEGFLFCRSKFCRSACFDPAFFSARKDPLSHLRKRVECSL